MKRYYLSTMVYVDERIGWAARALAQATPGQESVVTVTPPDPTAPGAWALCVVESPDHTKFGGNAANDAFPDLSLDAQLSTLTKATRDRLVAALEKRGIDTAGIGVNTTFREVLRRCGQVWRPSFNEDAFDASVS